MHERGTPSYSWWNPSWLAYYFWTRTSSNPLNQPDKHYFSSPFKVYAFRQLLHFILAVFSVSSFLKRINVVYLQKLNSQNQSGTQHINLTHSPHYTVNKHLKSLLYQSPGSGVTAEYYLAQSAPAALASAVVDGPQYSTYYQFLGLNSFAQAARAFCPRARTYGAH